MKNVLILLSLFLFAACQGPRGPEGPRGPKGDKGADGLLAEVFEVTAQFNAGNDYTAAYNLTPSLYDSDVLMIYIKWDEYEGEPVWRALPAVHFLNQGIIQYYFDYTKHDFIIRLGGDVNPATLGSAYLDNQVFRCVIIPGTFLENIDDVNDYKEVVDVLKISDTDFKELF